MRAGAANAGIGEQILNQSGHAARPADHKPDKLVGILIQLAFIAVGKQLGERHDRPERLLEIMRRHIGELLQLRVGALQVIGIPGERLFRPFPLADIAEGSHGSRYLSSLVAIDGTIADYRLRVALAVL